MCVCVGVCVCVCVCVSVCLSVCLSGNSCEQNSSRTDTPILTRFSLNKMVAYYTGSDPIEIGDLGLKVKVTVTQYPFFLHNSLLTSLLYILALVSLIKLKFCMPLRYALC